MVLPPAPSRLFGYEDNFVPEVIDPFLEANPDLDVQTAVFGSNDEAVTKLQNGFQADVINVCTEETRRMVDLGLLQPIDTSRIEAWDTLFPSLKEQEGVVVDGEVYMIPNVGGTSGIIYNPEEVPQGVDSYRDLFEDPALAGKVTLEDSATTVIAITALALGHEDPFALTEEDLTEIKDYLIEHKSAIRALFKGDADFLSLYRTGEIIAGFGYHDYRAAMTREGIPVEFVPGEGSLAWICGMSPLGQHAERGRGLRRDEPLHLSADAVVLRRDLHLPRLGPADARRAQAGTGGGAGPGRPHASWTPRSPCRCRTTTTSGSMSTVSSKQHEREERDERKAAEHVASRGGRGAGDGADRGSVFQLRR